MTGVDTVVVTLAHPLQARDAVKVGLFEQDYAALTELTVTTDDALRLIYAGMTTINPTDTAAIEALLASAAVLVSPTTEVPTFVGPVAPTNPPGVYLWWQTGTNLTLWIEDGT